MGIEGRARMTAVATGVTLKIVRGDKICMLSHNPTSTEIMTKILKKSLKELLSTGCARHGTVGVFDEKEMPLLEGRTIQENIVFGEPVNSNRIASLIRVLKFEVFVGLSDLDTPITYNWGNLLRREK